MLAERQRDFAGTRDRASWTLPGHAEGGRGGLSCESDTCRPPLRALLSSRRCSQTAVTAPWSASRQPWSSPSTPTDRLHQPLPSLRVLAVTNLCGGIGFGLLIFGGGVPLLIISVLIWSGCDGRPTGHARRPGRPLRRRPKPDRRARLTLAPIVGTDSTRQPTSPLARTPRHRPDGGLAPPNPGTRPPNSPKRSAGTVRGGSGSKCILPRRSTGRRAVSILSSPRRWPTQEPSLPPGRCGRRARRTSHLLLIDGNVRRPDRRAAASARQPGRGSGRCRLRPRALTRLPIGCHGTVVTPFR